ncbi:MAG: TonB family protein [Chthoniobacterales bacterium]|nr:TonB family protein [Chthoniobacterales bacterium]
MKKRIAAVLISSSLISAFIFPAAYAVEGSSAYLCSHGTNAVDAKGLRHIGDRYPRKHPPWLDEQTRSIAPIYPYRDRAHRNEGVGWLQLALDLKTGAVRSVAVMKSTGFASLDKAAIIALRQWRWRPDRWKQIELPVTFRIGHEPRQLPRGSVRLSER